MARYDYSTKHFIATSNEQLILPRNPSRVTLLVQVFGPGPTLIAFGMPSQIVAPPFDTQRNGPHLYTKNDYPALISEDVYLINGTGGCTIVMEITALDGLDCSCDVE